MGLQELFFKEMIEWEEYQSTMTVRVADISVYTDISYFVQVNVPVGRQRTIVWRICW